MPTLPTNTSEPIYRHKLTARTENAPPIDGREPPAHDGPIPNENGYLLDNCDGHRLRTRFFEQGAAFTLARSTKPHWLSPDMPVLSYAEGNNNGDGIVVKANDWKIDHARFNGFFEHGLDVQQGNLRVTASDFYGGYSDGIAARIRSGVSRVNLDGSLFSDAYMGIFTQGHKTSWNNCHSQHCTYRNWLVGAKSDISFGSVDIGFYDGKPCSATGIEFAWRDDPEFGHLCGNWSTLIGTDIDMFAGLAPEACAIQVDALMVTIKDVTVNGPADRDALRIRKPISGLVIEDMKLCGPGVVIEQLGENCRLNFLFHSEPRFKLPENWPASTHIFKNGVEVKPKGGGK